MRCYIKTKIRQGLFAYIFWLFCRPYVTEPPLLSPVKKRIRETSSPGNSRLSNNKPAVVVPDSPASIITISSDSEEERVVDTRRNNKPSAGAAASGHGSSRRNLHQQQQHKEHGRTENRNIEYNNSKFSSEGFTIKNGPKVWWKVSPVFYVEAGLASA